MEKIVQKIKIIFIPCEENRYRPEFLASNLLFYYLIFLIILKTITVSVLFYLPKSDFFAALTKEALIDLTNQERQSLGLNSLSENPILNNAALQKAQDMLILDYFGHYSPEGKSPWYWFQRAGYRYQKAGENLAIGFLEAEEVFRAWNTSLTHKANIINPDYEDVGIAVLKGNFQGKETTVVVQLFGLKSRPPILVQKIEAQEKGESKFEETVSQEEGEFKAEVGPPGASEKTFPPEPFIVVFPVRVIEDSPVLKFLKFMVIDYPELVHKVVFCSLIVMIIILLFTVLVRVDIQPRDLLLKAIFFIVVFSLFVLLDKETLLNWVPHNLNIG